jgi:hypothetical protein
LVPKLCVEKDAIAKKKQFPFITTAIATLAKIALFWRTAATVRIFRTAVHMDGGAMALDLSSGANLAPRKPRVGEDIRGLRSGFVNFGMQIPIASRET